MKILLLITFGDILQWLFNIVYTWCEVADKIFFDKHYECPFCE